LTVAIRAFALSVAVIAPLFLLTACDPATPVVDPSPTEAVESPSPTPTAVAVVVDPDALLLVTATATADNGAVLHLSMQVHKSTNWDDPEASDRPDLMTQTCEGGLDSSIYADQLWAFTSASVDATAVDGTPAWPSDKVIHLLPYVTDGYTLAPDGFVFWDEDVDSATPYCVRDMDINSAGSGALVIGIEGDSDTVGAAGNFTRWANTTYGFSGQEAKGQTAAQAGITITDCVFTVTDLGEQFHGGADWWSEHVTESACQIGGQP
jgi:hypothetical protein